MTLVLVQNIVERSEVIEQRSLKIEYNLCSDANSRCCKICEHDVKRIEKVLLLWKLRMPRPILCTARMLGATCLTNS